MSNVERLLSGRMMGDTNGRYSQPLLRNLIDRSVAKAVLDDWTTRAEPKQDHVVIGLEESGQNSALLTCSLRELIEYKFSLLSG